MDNISSIILSLNKNILNSISNKEYDCNCRSKESWPLQDKYLTSKIVYRADVKNKTSHLRWSIKNLFLKIPQNSGENTCARSSVLIKSNFIRKETLAQVFFCEFHNTFFTEHLSTTASERILQMMKKNFNLELQKHLLKKILVATRETSNTPNTETALSYENKHGNSKMPIYITNY